MTAAGPVSDELARAVRALASGFAGPSPGPVSETDPAYRESPDSGDLEIVYALPALNGSAIFRKPEDHAAAVRATASTESAEELRAGLRELTAVLDRFVAGLGRRPHRVADPEDVRGHSAMAYVGFGPTLFRDRESGKPRFGLGAEPRVLDLLRLRGDEEAGVDPARSQADLFIWLECDSYTLLLDGYEELHRHAQTAGWLELRDVRICAARGDGRNHHGFYDGVRNPTLQSRPSALDVALVDPEREDPALEGGSYAVFRRYRFDLERWEELGREAQELIVGTHKSVRGDLLPLPPGSHVRNAHAAGAPLVYRRGAGYVDARGDRGRGLAFVSFQRSPESLVRLHDDFLLGEKGGDRDRLVSAELVTPLDADVYFVPDHLGWGHVGEVFFEPDAFARLYAGAALARQGQVDGALDSYHALARDYPAFLPAHSNFADLAPDVGRLDEADEMADEALRIDPGHYLSLGAKAWLQYLRGDFSEAVELAGRAVESTSVDSFRAYPYHTLGASLVELGRPVEAEAALRRSAARANVEPLVCYSLGNSIDAQGRDADAERIYARTLEVVQYRLRYGLVSPRDRRNEFNMRFVRYRSERNQRALRGARDLLAGAPNTRAQGDEPEERSHP